MLQLLEGEGPPNLVELRSRVQLPQRFGGLLMGTFLVIIFLMIIQPGGLTPR